MKRGVFFGLLAVVVALVVFFEMFAHTTGHSADTTVARSHGASNEGDEAVGGNEPSRATGSATSTTPPSRADDPSATPTLDRAKRDQMRALIWGALGHPAPDAEAPPTKGTAYVLPVRANWPEVALDGTFGHLDPKDIQSAVRNDFFPLARDCYAKASAKDPTLAGRVVLAFNIVGDEKIGGIVEAVDVLDKSTLRDPDMIECMRQSFLSTTFPPPKGGGQVTVEYPIEFSNEDGG